MAQITIPNTFTPKQVIPSAGFNENYSSIASTYNEHDAATASVHGLGASEGAIVGAAKSQKISNKLYCVDWLLNTPVKPKVYYINPTDLKAYLASPNTSEIHKYQLIVGLNVAGYGAYAGELDGVSFTFSAPQQLYLSSSGIITNEMPAAGRIITVGHLITDTKMIINFGIAEEMI